MSETIDISDLSKAAVLAALFNGTVPSGMGWLQALSGPTVMTIDEAQDLIDAGKSPDPGSGLGNHGRIYFDYLYGKPMKVDLTDDEFDPRLYDRDNGGAGAAQRLIKRLRESVETK